MADTRRMISIPAPSAQRRMRAADDSTVTLAVPAASAAAIARAEAARAAAFQPIATARTNAFTPTPAQAAAWRAPARDLLPLFPAMAGGRVPVDPVIEPTVIPVAPAAPLIDGGAVAQAVGNYARNSFPTINAVREDRTAENDLAAGNVGRGLGGLVRKAAGYIAAGGTDLVGRPAAAIGQGLGSFFGGAVGGALGVPEAGLDTSVRKLVGAPAPKPAVTQALAQGRAAAVTDESLNSVLGTKLSKAVAGGKLSFKELMGIGAVAPGLAKQGQSAKDAIIGLAAAQAEKQHTTNQQAIAADLAAGNITQEDATKASALATQTFYDSYAQLAGVDITKQRLPTATDGE